MHITWKGLVTKAALGAIAINALTLSIAPAGYTLNRDHGFGSGQLQINGAGKPVWGKYSPTIPSPDLIFDRLIDKKSNTYLALNLGPIAEPIGGVAGRVVGLRFGGRPGASVGNRVGRKVGHHTGRGLSRLHHLNRGFFKHF